MTTATQLCEISQLLIILVALFFLLPFLHPIALQGTYMYRLIYIQPFILAWFNLLFVSVV